MYFDHGVPVDFFAGGFGRCNPWVPSGSALTLRKVVKVPEASIMNPIRKMGEGENGYGYPKQHTIFLVGWFWRKKNGGEICCEGLVDEIIFCW